MIGGIFEGADNPGFINADTLHEIKSRPYRLFTEVLINSPKKYKYIRYKGVNGSYCNVSELEFISNKTKLMGKIIGKEGSWNNNKKYEYTAAFDGLTETSYDYSNPNDGWVGIKLDSPKQVTKIRYAPRNYGNYIKEGNDYGLFVSSKGGWTLLGRKKATSDSLSYAGVSIRGLFYLKNYSGGQEERIFIVEDNKQVFK